MNNPRFPEEIQCRITDSFLITFKDELDRIFADKKPAKPTYWNFYQWFDSTGGFDDALKSTCELHDFMELYEYLQGLEWYDSDILDGSLTEMLYKRGIIKKGTYAEYWMLERNVFKRIKQMIIYFTYKAKLHYESN